MSCCDGFKTFCAYVVLMQLACGVFRWIYENHISPRIGKQKDFKSFGQWAGLCGCEKCYETNAISLSTSMHAVVTGATDGIGKEYAKSVRNEQKVTL